MKLCILKKDNINIQEYEKIIKKLDFTIDDKNPDFILTFGGDGTILKAVDIAIKYDIPIIPVNFGKIGYMADIEKEELEEVLVDIKKGDYTLSVRDLLKCIIDDKKYYALNDVVFKSEHISEYELYENDKYITRYRGDGLIISTSTGSSAYAMSAGGSLIHPSLKVMNIVAIAPQTLSARPIILPPISLNIKSSSNIYIDGLKVSGDNTSVINVSFSDKRIKLINSKTKTYYDILKTKLEWLGYK